MPTQPSVSDVYTELQEFADKLWDISQSVDSDQPTTDKAMSMYNTLENVYLEPVRRKMYQADDAALAAAATQLNKATTGLNQTINDLAKVIQTTNQIDQYVKVFDQVLATAAKVLAVMG
jgi:hypothetical protein